MLGPIKLSVFPIPDFKKERQASWVAFYH
jgi:hypothetical protein